MLIDDSKLSLMHLQDLLEKEVGCIQVVGTFTDPLQAIEQARSLFPEVVFLDINMPDISGLEVGEQLQGLDHSPEIVFVTGYDEYAVDAFELNALDYIIKPVQLTRLKKTIDRLQKRITKAHEDVRRWKTSLFSIQCFRSLAFHIPNQEPNEIKWRTVKSRELFLYLLHNRNKMIDKESLIELLWHDCDENKGGTLLYTTIYLIRQTLKSHGLKTIEIKKSNMDRGYKLTIDSATIDVEEWEADIKNLPPLSHSSIDVYEKVLAMYAGDYLGEYDYLWAEYERERLCRMWLQLAKKMSRFYLEQGRVLEATMVNERVQLLYPLEEDSYMILMQLYASLDNNTAVKNQYKLLTTRWEQELNSLPSIYITEWYEAWKKETDKRNFPNRD
ncbi:response regulator [Brevibacillus fortis]|nr:response regulator [Brevibacillus fortis]